MKQQSIFTRLSKRLAARLLFLLLTCLLNPVAVQAQQAQGLELTSALNGSSTPTTAYAVGSGLSADGRYTVFLSYDKALPGANGYSQIYRRNLQTLATELVTSPDGGTTALAYGGWNDYGQSPYNTISQDGRYTLFTSNSPELPGTSSGSAQIFRRDMISGAVELASALDGSMMPAQYGGYGAHLSANGRYIVFGAYSPDLPDYTGNTQVYRRDMQTQRTELASIADTLNTWVQVTDISPDGRYVLLFGFFEGLPDFNGNTRVYRRDMLGSASDPQSFTLASAADGSDQPLNAQNWAKISADGRYVVFDAYNVDGSNMTSLFRRDIQTRRTVIASAPNGSTQPASISTFEANISGNGRYISFMSYDMIVPTANGLQQVYRRDMDTLQTILISTPDGTTPEDNWAGYASALSFDGSVLTFSSSSSNLGTDNPSMTLLSYVWRSAFNPPAPPISGTTHAEVASSTDSSGHILQTIAGFFYPPANLIAQPGSVFIAVYFPDTVVSSPNTIWVMDSAGNWHLFSDCRITPAYFTGDLQSLLNIPILPVPASLANWPGAELYIGYGLGGYSAPSGSACNDMLARNSLTKVLVAP